MPVESSVYFTDTGKYHTEMNGGGDQRVHIEAALQKMRVEHQGNYPVLDDSAKGTIKHCAATVPK